MAAEKNEVLDFVKEFGVGNNRPCPKKEAVAKYGEDALAHLKALVDEGILGCRRGRNGGYYLITGSTAASTSNNDAPVEAENAPQNSEESEIDNDALAEQFAALEARLAAAEAAEQNIEA
jgi:hypothetical protein